MIHFTIYGDPRPQARARRSKNGGMYTPNDKGKSGDKEGSTDYRERVRNSASEAMQEELVTPIMRGPVCVFIEIVKQSGISGLKKADRVWLDLGNLILHPKKPDSDNVIKQICDALNGVVWVDDGQVVFAHAIKTRGREPLVNVWVWETSKLNWTHETIEDLVEMIEKLTTKEQ